MTDRDLLVSVVLVLRDDEDIAREFLTELVETVGREYRYFEIVVVDDASRDGTVRAVEDLQGQLKNIQLYCLPRRRGSEVGQVAGLENAIGDMVVLMEPRYDPAHLVPRLVEVAVAEGCDIVYGLPEDRTLARSRHARISNFFFRVLSRLSDLDLPSEASRARLLSRRVVNFVLEVTDRHRTVFVAPALSGYPYRTLPYSREASQDRARKRAAWRPRISEAVDLLVSTSMRPLRLVTLLALFFGGVAMAYGGLAVVLKYWIMPEGVAPGWTSLSLQISGLFLLVFLILAVMSEYLLRISEMTNRHPTYHIKRESRSAVMDFEQDLNVRGGS